MTLIDQLPPAADPDSVFDAFADWAERRDLSLYPHQEEALIEIVSGANVIVSSPCSRVCRICSCMRETLLIGR